jgi:hypothetical protein
VSLVNPFTYEKLINQELSFIVEGSSKNQLLKKLQKDLPTTFGANSPVNK